MVPTLPTKVCGYLLSSFSPAQFVANDSITDVRSVVARGAFSETTIGCADLHDGAIWKSLFHTPQFRVSVTSDVRGVSLCGALKNVVAVAAGLVDGLGWGNNAKSAIMRIGLMEMKKFSLEFFEGIQKETFVEEVSPSSITSHHLLSFCDVESTASLCSPG